VKLEAFDFDLPAELVAQRALEPRDASRLLVLERETGRMAHRRFADLDRLLRRGDLLVLNDTRVLPARLLGRKPSGGRVELLLLEAVGGDETRAVWRCLVRCSHRPAPGSRIDFGAELVGRLLAPDAVGWKVALEAPPGRIDALLDELGRTPLPPYIRRGDGEPDASDRTRYQTVYARRPGAVAAPTAGLHFTTALLAALADRGVDLAYLTQHVGPGTFLPVRTARVEEHRLQPEWFELPASVAAAVERTRRKGGRVVAVGTTVVRALESCADADGRVAARSGHSELFIYPGFRFRVVDALLTNFHLPRSTLLLLVAAFAGRERVLAAYAEAIRCRYRFYSYGDAMLIGAFGWEG
jgi:S-adenosylmethionine:tRNA ribosyltransferase-isomerase